MEVGESQAGWGWKGPLGVTWSNLHAQAGTHKAQDHVQMAFEHLQEWELYNLSWATRAGAQPPSQEKKWFLIFKGNLLCFHFYPLLLVTGHNWNEPDLFSHTQQHSSVGSCASVIVW